MNSLTPAGTLSMPPSLRPEERLLAAETRERLWFGDDDPDRTSYVASSTMAAHIGMISGLKPFPVVAQKVIALVNRANTSPKELREAVECDPALSSQLLRLANSAFFRRGSRCSTIEDAIVRLGFGEIERLVSGFAAMGMFQDERGVGLRFREHCVRVGAIVKVLADDVDERISARAYLCGLLHDIGKLLSLQVKEIPYETFSKRVLSSPDETHIRERQAAGYDHAVLGSHVLEQWNLPETIVETVAYHHQPGRAFHQGGEVATFVSLVRSADRLEYILAADGKPGPTEFEAVARDAAGNHLNLSAGRLAVLWPRMTDLAFEMTGVMGPPSVRPTK